MGDKEGTVGGYIKGRKRKGVEVQKRKKTELRIKQTLIALAAFCAPCICKYPTMYL